MENSSFKFVPDPVSDQFTALNVDIAVKEDNGFACDSKNSNAARLTK